MKKICLFAVCLLSAISSSMAQSNEMFTNPVIHGDLADPTVIRWGKSYYAAGTSSEWAPSYPVYKSDDLAAAGYRRTSGCRGSGAPHSPRA